MSFPAGFSDKFFAVGKKIACPSIEKDGECFDIEATNPVHSWSVQR